MITLLPVHGIPEITPGTDLGSTLADALRACRITLTDGDIVVVTSKIVSKAEGLFAAHGDRARLTLEESQAVVTERATSGAPTRVVSALAGPVMAGAGIDASNAADDRLLLLPRDPDASAARVHAGLAAAVGGTARFGVVLSDTAGRPWRAGLVDFALGLHGIDPLDDLRGRPDTEGRDLAVTVRNLADEIAAAADLVKGKVDRVPAAVVRGLSALVTQDPATPRARDLVRKGPDDWFSMGRAEAVRAALGVPPGSAASEAVGVESVHPEPLVERVRRAARVALSGGDAARIEATPDSAPGGPDGTVTATLTADDPVVLGRTWARLEVALAGERLVAQALAREPHGLRLQVSPGRHG